MIVHVRVRRAEPIPRARPVAGTTCTEKRLLTLTDALSPEIPLLPFVPVAFAEKEKEEPRGASEVGNFRIRDGGCQNYIVSWSNNRLK